MAMLRDDAANALSDMPVTPDRQAADGSEFTRYALALPASGALYQRSPCPKSSRRGVWSASAYIDPKAAPVGRVEFSVEDFVPEKLKVELTLDQAMLRTGQGQRFWPCRRIPLWRAGLGPQGREATCASLSIPSRSRLSPSTLRPRGRGARNSSRR
jgi:hypothetical protein